MQGKLYLCATPIGNLEDITLRVLRVLRECDAVWAEDTRHTLQLLNHFEIKKPLVSCHEHNERERASLLAAELQAGKTIAYCSDAGMPGISDPGATLIAACYENDLPCEVLPGASAAPMAAVLSGLDCARFTFFGFLPREKKPRQEALNCLAVSPCLSLVYESPLRLPATLRELSETLGEARPAAVLRELTKLHEECARGTLAELCARFAQPPKGECVIAIAGRTDSPQDAAAPSLDDALTQALSDGLSVKDAAAAAAIACGCSKKEAYARALALRE